MESLLATVFFRLLLKRFFDSPFDFPIVSGRGRLASFRILEQKPLEILRGE